MTDIQQIITAHLQSWPEANVNAIAAGNIDAVIEYIYNLSEWRTQLGIILNGVRRTQRPSLLDAVTPEGQ